MTKDKINKRGYNKFLEISEDVAVKINYDAVKEDARWDGLKGYMQRIEYKILFYRQLQLRLTVIF